MLTVIQFRIVYIPLFFLKAYDIYLQNYKYSCCFRWFLNTFLTMWHIHFQCMGGVLRKIFVSRGQEVVKDWRKLLDKELHKLYSPQNNVFD